MSQEKAAGSTPRKEEGMKTLILVTASLSVFIASFMVTSINVALPSIGREFGASAIQLNWLVTAYVLTVAALSLPFGRLADIIGIKKVIVFGMVLYTISSTIAVFAGSVVMLIACRAVQGTSAAMIMVNVLAMLTLVYPAQERGRALGINVAAVYIGSSLGPFLGGLLTENLGWRSIFLVTIPVCLTIVLILLWKVRMEWRECKGQKFDYAGSLIFILALVVLMYGSSLIPEIAGAILIAAGTIGLLFFLKWESRAKSPLLDVNVLRNNRAFIFSSLAFLINYSTVFAVAFLLSLYLQYIKGLSADQAGLILIAHPVIQALLSPWAGRLSDKMEPRFVASIGMALTSMGLLVFVFTGSGTPLWQVLMGLIIVGVGFAMFLSPNSNALMSSVQPRYYGTASATMSTMISLGQMLSMGITMVVMTLVIGNTAITPEYYPAFTASTRIAFGIFTLLCIGGVFISVFRGKSQEKLSQGGDK
ncbi:MAG: MFS transporter [Dehalococcoidales bacterium]|nr:MFS transporter [Dehalococcoidales bacterium]